MTCGVRALFQPHKCTEIIDADLLFLYLSRLTNLFCPPRYIHPAFSTSPTFPSIPTLSVVETSQMSNREDSVYLAKLAEQAERYEGECFLYAAVATRRFCAIPFAYCQG